MVSLETSTTTPQQSIFAGVFGTGEDDEATRDSRRLAQNLEALLGGGTGADATTGFGPRSTAEEDLLDQLVNQANQRTSLRGLGPASGTDIAKSIAPVLLQLRQQEEENRLARGGQQLQGRGQTLQGLLNLIGLAAPQPIITEETDTSGFALLGGADPFSAL